MDKTMEEFERIAESMSTKDIIRVYGVAGGLVLMKKFYGHITTCAICREKYLEILNHLDSKKV